MKAIHKQRLLKLAKHLRSGKLGHKKFDFRVLNVDDRLQIVGHCGTLGCAWGECPVIFPTHLMFVDSPEGVLLRRDSTGETFADAEKFFDITPNESSHLFVPGCQEVGYGGIALDMHATAKQVAANIEAFVKIKSKKQTNHGREVRI
jgi:hypothetical protein